MTIVSASANTWTLEGLLGSAFGLAVVLVILPVGIVHGLAACFSRILENWKREPNGRLEQLKFHMGRDLQEMYLVVGWFFSICAILLTIYFVVRQRL